MSEVAKPPEGAVATPPKPAAPAAPPKPPMPPKPAVSKAAGPSRRGFLYTTFCTWFGLAWVAFSAAMAGMTLGTLRFMFPNVLSEPPSKVKVGPPDAFEEGKVVERFKDQNIWVVHYRGQDLRPQHHLHAPRLHAQLARSATRNSNAPATARGFYITGVNFEGPAPRPLERWAISIGEDGQIWSWTRARNSRKNSASGTTRNRSSRLSQLFIVSCPL